MKFISLKMRNWRSFHGDHEIGFSQDPNRPVTLLLGPNGAGKTGLLNAFTWCLYGQFTEGFDHSDRLVNLESADVDPAAETWVKVVLQHDNDEFRIRRSTDARRQVTSEYEVVVTKNGERATEDDIHRILPKPLKDLFFFPAETFSTASVLKGDNPGDGTSFDVGTAIRSLLSGDIYDHASEDLRQAMENQALKPPKNYRDETIDKAQRQYEQAQDELNEAEKRRGQLPALLGRAREQAAKAKKDAERYNPEEIRNWEKEKERLRWQVTEAVRAADRANVLYVDLARHAHRHFSRCAIATAIARLDLAEAAGLMPPRIDESVLQRTLETGRCVLCHEPLEDDARRRVETLRTRVGDAQVAIRGLEARTTLRQYAETHNNELDRLREEIAELAEELEVDVPPEHADMKLIRAVLRTCIDVADRLLTKAQREFDDFNANNGIELPADGKSPVEIAMVRQALVDALQSEFGGVDERIDTLNNKVKETFSDYQVKSGKSNDHKLKTSAIAILQEAKSYFDAARKGLEEFGRRDFQKAINSTYSDLISKPFEIRVDTDFSINVFLRHSDEKMPLSQSEKVLLLIAFLGAIARLAPHYEEIAKQSQQLQLTGGVETSRASGFPVVLDSPTSPLDEEYEVEVVTTLPSLLPQVIVPVSAKSVSVWERIESQIGCTYVMELTSSTASNRIVHWLGKDYTYSTEDENVIPARTRITRIE